jgi:hypothetical protein
VEGVLFRPLHPSKPLVLQSTTLQLVHRLLLLIHHLLQSLPRKPLRLPLQMSAAASAFPRSLIEHVVPFAAESLYWANASGSILE